MTIILFI